MQGLRKERIRFSIYILGSIMLIIIGILISIHTGYLDIPISRMIATFLGKGTSADTLTIFEFRLPRIVIALLVGMGIAISGTILQSISKIRWQIQVYLESMLVRDLRLSLIHSSFKD